MSSLRSVSVEHFNLTAESSENNMNKEVTALVATCKDAEKAVHFKKEMTSFERLFKTYMSTRHQTIDWSLISPPKEDLILPLSTLPTATHQKELASKLCILKLNGGLGTTMGCVGPKSAIEVREGSSFLDLNVKQVKVRSQFYGFPRSTSAARSLNDPLQWQTTIKSDWLRKCMVIRAERGCRGKTMTAHFFGPHTLGLFHLCTGSCTPNSTSSRKMVVSGHFLTLR